LVSGSLDLTAIRAAGGVAIGKLHCHTRFTQAHGLFIARLRNLIQSVHRLSPGEKFRLDFAERNLCLLAGFAECFCHGGRPRKDARRSEQ
jgi:hypothetical protein